MDAHEIATYITKNMDLRNGWIINGELEDAIETTLEELMLGDRGSAEIFLRDLACSFESAADNLN